MSMYEFEVLKNVGQNFRIPGKIYSVDHVKNGNINKTFRVTYTGDDNEFKAYMFQKVNTNVFHNPKEIMDNIDKVTSHIREYYPNETTVHFHHTEDGKNYMFDNEGSFWRVMNYVESVTYDTCDDYTVIASTGEAFGHFQMQLSNFDGSQLYETIPEFHSTHKRLDKLFADAAKDEFDRVKEVQDELEYISSVRRQAGLLSIRYEKGEFPVRVTHNDTKSNNVLFDRITKRPIVVIDLDTVMPGMAVYDFGDAVRFICNTSAEDEPDPRRVFFDTGKFRAFCKGYISEVKGALTKEEIAVLIDATFDITIELASRFLDDYITGDKYFKVNYPAHNLVRTRCQLKLAQDIERKREELEWIVQETMTE